MSPRQEISGSREPRQHAVRRTVGFGWPGHRLGASVDRLFGGGERVGGVAGGPQPEGERIQDVTVPLELRPVGLLRHVGALPREAAREPDAPDENPGAGRPGTALAWRQIAASLGGR